MDPEYYWDEAGDPRARGGGAPIVGRYLEADLQTNLAQAREIVHAVDRVLAGRLRAWSETGNAYTLALTPRGAVLEPTADDAAKPVHVGLEDLRRAVAGWVRFLEAGRPRT